MKEKFIKRYMDSVNDYFNYDSDTDGRMVRHYVVEEYEKILEEVFEMKHEEVKAIYFELYNKKYGKETRG